MTSYHPSLAASHVEPSKPQTATTAKTGNKERKLRQSCRECASHKLKCSGGKPSCVRCAERGLECFYDLSRRSGRVSWQDRLRAQEMAAMPTGSPFMPPVAEHEAQTAGLPSPLSSPATARRSPSWQASALGSDAGSSRSSSVSLGFSDASMISAPLEDCIDYTFELGDLQAHFEGTQDLAGSMINTGFDHMAPLSPASIPGMTASIPSSPSLSMASDFYNQPLPYDTNCVSGLEALMDIDSMQVMDAHHDQDGTYDCLKVANHCLQRLSWNASQRCVRANPCGPQPVPVPCTQVVAENKQCLAILDRVLDCAPATHQDIFVIITLALMKIVEAYQGAVHDNMAGPTEIDGFLPAHDPSYYCVTLTEPPPPLQSIMGELHRVQSMVRRLSERLDTLNALYNAAAHDQSLFGPSGRPPMSPATFDALHRDLRRYLDAASFRTIQLLNAL